MPTSAIADQAAEGDADCALALLANPILDPVFRAQARSGIASAWHAHVPFAQWLVSATRPALIVELGTHHGVSYAAFCETVLQEKLATRCYGVDSWSGDDHAGHYDESVYAALREFHDARYSAFSELLRMTFDEAREMIADGTVDLLHIDGFHSYDAARHDFEAWAPKLSQSAVVLFHDINVLERGFGVVRFWAEVEGRFPSFSFLHGHGLGVLAVGPDVPPVIRRLCATGASSAVAVLRERFASLGRVHALDYALAETVRHEQRLRREAAERDGVVETLRRSLDEVLRDREAVLAAKALAEQHLPALEATIARQREALRQAQTAQSEARDQAALQEAAALDQAARLAAALDSRERKIDERDQTIAVLQAQGLADQAELSRLRGEIEALWGNLAAARADTKAAREEGQAEAARLGAEIDKRNSEMAALRAVAEATATAPRPGLGLRPRRH